MDVILIQEHVCTGIAMLVLEVNMMKLLAEHCSHFSDGSAAVWVGTRLTMPDSHRCVIMAAEFCPDLLLFHCLASRTQ